MIVLAIALPDALLLYPEDFLRLAERAFYNAVRPAKAQQKGFAVLEISEVQNGILQGLWRFHVMIIVMFMAIQRTMIATTRSIWQSCWVSCGKRSRSF